MPYSFVCRLFEKIDINKDGLITFDEFKLYALQKPEYSRILLTYHELKANQNSKNNEDVQSCPSQRLYAFFLDIMRVEQCRDKWCCSLIAQAIHIAF